MRAEYLPQQLMSSNKSDSVPRLKHAAKSDINDSFNIDFEEEEFGYGKLTDRDISFNPPVESTRDLQLFEALEKGEPEDEVIRQLELDSVKFTLSKDKKKKNGCFCFFC